MTKGRSDEADDDDNDNDNDDDDDDDEAEEEDDEGTGCLLAELGEGDLVSGGLRGHQAQVLHLSVQGLEAHAHLRDGVLEAVDAGQVH